MSVRLTGIEPEPWLSVTLEVEGVALRFYQPIEGGWRCQEDGPLRYGENGMVITFDNLSSAAAAMSNWIESL